MVAERPFRRAVGQRGIMRIAYIYGPVDAREVHAAWKSNGSLAYLGSSYVSQFLEQTSQRDATSLIITSHAGDAYDAQYGSVRIRNIPWPEASGGLRFHLDWARWMAEALRAARSFGPDITVLSAAQNYWFLARPILPKTTFVVALHGAIWPRIAMGPLQRVVTRLNRRFYRRSVRDFLVASDLISRQIDEFCDGPKDSKVFLPTYAPERFEGATPLADLEAAPFRVFFAGRIEANKGIYDLVEIAARFEAALPGAVRFDVCGEGSDLESLRKAVTDGGLGDVVTVHGFCAAPEMLALLDRCHVTLVPTRTDFEEGFNMVCSESVLWGRPVITSDVCPALEYLPNSAIEVAPDDVDGYEAALRSLLEDPDRLGQLASGCALDRGQFLDESKSYGTLLAAILDDIDDGVTAHSA